MLFRSAAVLVLTALFAYKLDQVVAPRLLVQEQALTWLCGGQGSVSYGVDQN